MNACAIRGWAPRPGWRFREDETAADCTGVNPISTKLLAFALDASFSGSPLRLRGEAAGDHAGGSEFQVVDHALCMVVLGGRRQSQGRDPRRPCSSRSSIASRSRRYLQALGRTRHGRSGARGRRRTLWRWFFFASGGPRDAAEARGAAGRRVRPIAPATTISTRRASRRRRAASSPAGLAPRARPARAARRIRFSTCAAGQALRRRHRPGRGRPGRPPGRHHRAHRSQRPRANHVLQRRDGSHSRRTGAASRSRARASWGPAQRDRTSAGSRAPSSRSPVPQMTVLENVLVGRHCRLRASVPGAVLRPSAVVAKRLALGSGRASCSPSSASTAKEQDVARNLPYGDQRRPGDRQGTGHRAAAFAARRADRGMNPRETENLTPDRIAPAGARAGDSSDRARYGSRDGELRPHHRARLRRAHRRGHEPAGIQRHPKVIEAYWARATSASPMLELATSRTYYGNIRALRGVSSPVRAGRDRDPDREQRRRQDDHVTDDSRHGSARDEARSPSAPASRYASPPTASCAGIAQSPGGPGDLPAHDRAWKSRACASVRKDRSAIAPDLERVFALFPRWPSAWRSTAGRSLAASSRSGDRPGR